MSALRIGSRSLLAGDLGVRAPIIACEQAPTSGPSIACKQAPTSDNFLTAIARLRRSILNPTVAAPVLSLRRKILYAAVLTGITLALVAGVMEMALRISGYGYSPHFARRVTLPNGEKIWRENRWCTAPFFSPALVRRPLPFRLTEKKAPGTYRIFVLGSSAAMGDPEPSFSFARILESMLRSAYPGTRFEVVNAAITAINSHIVRGIAEDCARLEPDLFIVYEGHNEVIGPFGPAGVFTSFLRHESLIRAVIWLKGTRTGQLISALGRALKGEHGTTRMGWHANVPESANPSR